MTIDIATQIFVRKTINDIKFNMGEITEDLDIASSNNLLNRVVDNCIWEDIRVSAGNIIDAIDDMRRTQRVETEKEKAQNCCAMV